LATTGGAVPAAPVPPFVLSTGNSVGVDLNMRSGGRSVAVVVFVPIPTQRAITFQVECVLSPTVALTPISGVAVPKLPVVPNPIEARICATAAGPPETV